MKKKKYLQLTFEDRRLLSLYRSRGLSQRECARRLNVSASTISRELKRNGRAMKREDLEFYARLDPTHSEEFIRLKLLEFKSGQTDWQATTAQRTREYRLHLANKLRRRKKPETAAWVIARIRDHWSPEQIAGRSKLDAPEPVSRGYVYQLLCRDKQKGGTLYRLLKRFGKRKQRLNDRIYPSWLNPDDKVSIEQRPKEANERSETGHLEADLICGANQSGYILSVIDRRSRILVLRKLRTKRSKLVRVQLERAIRKLGGAKTITLDNGTEFFQHAELSKNTGTKVFFTHPYCSTDKGSIENANALIRYYFPKRKPFHRFTQKRLDQIEHRLNHRPRKILGFMTPCEAHPLKKPPKTTPRKCCTSKLHPPVMFS